MHLIFLLPETHKNYSNMILFCLIFVFNNKINKVKEKKGDITVITF